MSVDNYPLSMKLFLIVLLICLFVLSVCITGCTSTSSGQSIGGISSSSCFNFSDVTSNQMNYPGTSLYTVRGNVTNTCMKNFGSICVHATFYDSDNMVVGSKGYLIHQMQHGTTVWFGVDNLYEPGAGTNKATSYKLEAYELGSENSAQC